MCFVTKLLIHVDSYVTLGGRMQLKSSAGGYFLTHKKLRFFFAWSASVVCDL